MTHSASPSSGDSRAGARMVRVPDDRAGQRLDNFLLGELKGLPKSLIYKLIRSGQVRVNGGRAKAERKLEGGEEVRVPPVRLAETGDKPTPPTGFMNALDAAIVYEDARLLALNKPSGVASHRVAKVLGVDADLVGTARFDPHLAIRLPAAALQQLEMAKRRLAGRAAGANDLDMAFATLAQANVQRRVHAHHPIGHPPGQQRQVALAEAGAAAAALAHQHLHFGEGRALLGDDQQPGGIPVQPVHQLQ